MSRRLTLVEISIIQEYLRLGRTRKWVMWKLALSRHTVDRYASPENLERQREKEARAYKRLRSDPERYELKLMRKYPAKIRNIHLEEKYEKLAELTSPELAIEAKLWLEAGTVPGAFLRSVIRNDLHEAVSRAPNPDWLTLVVKWFYHEAPKGSWGADKCLGNWPMYIRAKRKQESEDGPVS